jgi:hypothetical protein
LPNISENILPSTRRTLYRTGPTSQTPYQILVLTTTTLNSLLGMGEEFSISFVCPFPTYATISATNSLESLNFEIYAVGNLHL